MTEVERVYAVSQWGAPVLIVREVERRTAKMIYLLPERKKSHGSSFSWIKQLPIAEAKFTPDEAWTEYIEFRKAQLQGALRTVNQLRSQIGEAERAQRRSGNGVASS